MGIVWFRQGKDLLKCRSGMIAVSLKSNQKISANDNAYAMAEAA